MATRILTPSEAKALAEKHGWSLLLALDELLRSTDPEGSRRGTMWEEGARLGALSIAAKARGEA